jgi:hypothetical protein
MASTFTNEYTALLAQMLEQCHAFHTVTNSSVYREAAALMAS